MSVTVNHLHSPSPIGSVKLTVGPTRDDKYVHELTSARDGFIRMSAADFSATPEKYGYQIYTDPEDLIKWCEATIQMMRQRLAERGDVY